MSKLKAEKREQKKRRVVAKTSASLAGQIRKTKINKNYKGDVKKLKK